MKKSYIKYSILIWVWMVLWAAISNIWNVFGATPWGGSNPTLAESIINTGCIEYVLPSWWTGVKCDNAIVYYKTWSSQEHQYFIQKRQKTWSMTNFTTWDVIVQSGGYIQYRVNFGSITWACNNWTIKDLLPSCVRYVSSEIYGVSGSPSFSTWNWYLQYTNFRLNSGASWYILVTGQIIANTPGCVNETRYVNTWWFKCGNPSSNWIYSSVVARRQWGWQGWSGVVFTKSWNKTEMVPGETWLVFTLTVVNNWPNNITWLTIDDIRPNPGNKNCIIFEGWSWSSWSGDAYTRHYIKNNWVLRSKGGSATLQLYASIKNESYCIWSYINTWKLTYHELWNTYTLTGYHQFKVVDAWTQYDVSIEKTVYPNGSVTHWGNITYTIEYTNTWKKPLTGFWIRDYWPKQQVQFDRSTPSPTNTGNWEVIGWYFTWPLAPGSGWTITIHGIVN